MKSSDFGAAEVQRMIDRANRDTGREPTDVDVAAAHGHLNRGAGFGGSEWGELVRAEARVILTERARAASMPALKKLLDEGGLRVPRGRGVEWTVIDEAAAPAGVVPGLIAGADFQTRPADSVVVVTSGARVRRREGAIDTETRDRIREIAAIIDPAGKHSADADGEWLRREAAPDSIHLAIDALLRFVLGCPQGERWMGAELHQRAREAAQSYRDDRAQALTPNALPVFARGFLALLGEIPGASTNRWLSVDEQREYEALRVALLRAVRS